MKRTAASIPLMKNDHPWLRQADGSAFVKEIPEDMDRRYDEAVFNMMDHRLRAGLHIPKAT